MANSTNDESGLDPVPEADRPKPPGQLYLEVLAPHPADAFVQEVTLFKGNTAKELTEAGVVFVEKLSAIGAPIHEIAGFLKVSETWLERQMREIPDVKAAVEKGRATRKLQLRAAGIMLEQTNPSVNIHARKAVLGEVPVEKKEVEHTVHVIGRRPTAELSASDWAKMYGPGVEDAQILEETPPDVLALADDGNDENSVESAPPEDRNA